ncbi:hypothetical protein C8Q80DRAFT_425341 [Daedaleopsis nitida]|nr:hypothetical protein C8Q80DRAFT_425341 [Daedaleopsis nitida]
MWVIDPWIHRRQSSSLEGSALAVTTMSSRPDVDTYPFLVVDDSYLDWPIDPATMPNPEAHVWDAILEAQKDDTYFAQTMSIITVRELELVLVFVGVGHLIVSGIAYPWLNTGAPTATYTLDDRPPVTLQPPNTAVTTANVGFFAVHNMSSGQHKLIIHILAEPEWPYVLDYIMYSPDNSDSGAQDGSDSTSSDTPSSSPTSTGGGQTAQETSTINPSNASSLSHRARAGAIVGVVVGVVLLALLGLYLWYRRRRRAMVAIAVANTRDGTTPLHSTSELATTRSTSGGHRREPSAAQMRAVPGAAAHSDAVRPTIVSTTNSISAMSVTSAPTATYSVVGELGTNEKASLVRLEPPAAGPSSSTTTSTPPIAPPGREERVHDMTESPPAYGS